MPVIIHDFEIVVEEPEAPPASPSLPPPTVPPPPALRPADVRLILRREAQRAERVRAH